MVVDYRLAFDAAPVGLVISRNRIMIDCNRQLCEMFDVAPLDFDGLEDSVFQPFNRQGEQSMEYLVDHGQFADVPQELFFGHLEKCYPHLFDAQQPQVLADLRGDLSRG